MPKGIYVRTHFIPVGIRLFKKTIKTESCWLWQGSKSKFGHGSIAVWINNKKVLKKTHRVSWELVNGDIPNNLFVLHKCDVPNCINPAHLFLGTKAENYQDMINKKRQKVGSALPQTKLKESQINEIRSSTLKQSQLALIFRTSQSNISNIINRKRWKHS